MLRTCISILYALLLAACVKSQPKQSAINTYIQLTEIYCPS